MRYPRLLKKAVEDAALAGYCFSFGAEQEFYLFRLDETASLRKFPMIKPDIWILHPMTAARISDVKYA